LKLDEVRPGENVTEIVVRVVSKAPPRIVTTRSGRKTQLTEVLVADETGTAILSLWGFGEGANIGVGKIVRIKDGWAKEFRGKVQLSLGRSGVLEELEEDGSVPEITDLVDHLSADEEDEDLGLE
jgi:ssDNA-binding replication factor A large subunit